MGRTIIRNLIITVILTSLMLVAYYLFWLKPSLELPNALLDTQQAFSQSHVSLLQNRIALIELIRLDANSAGFDPTRARLLAELQQTNEQGLQVLDEQSALPTIVSAPNEHVSFVNSELGPAWLELMEEHRSVLTDQQSLITTLTTLDSTLANIFKYQPQSDLIELDITTDQNTIIGRSRAAHLGLQSIADNLSNPEDNWPDTLALQSAILDTQTALVSLTSNLETESSPATDSREAVLRQFSQLKSVAWLTLLAPVRAQSSVMLLTRQTNIIYQYQYWQDSIAAHLSLINL